MADFILTVLGIAYILVFFWALVDIRKRDFTNTHKAFYIIMVLIPYLGPPLYWLGIFRGKRKTEFEGSAEKNKATNEVKNIGRTLVKKETTAFEIELDATKEIFEQLNSKTAESDEAKTLYNNGLMYDGTDHKKAFEFYEKAAAKGSNNAYYAMGEMYRSGVGVLQDYNKAVKYYLIAAKNNQLDAIVALGTMYQEGLGVQKDPTQSFHYYSVAARLGDYNAMYNCGCALHIGNGVPKDYKMAHAMFTLAIDYGDEEAIHEKNDNAKKISASEKKEADIFIKEMKKIINENINKINYIDNQTEVSSESKTQIKNLGNISKKSRTTPEAKDIEEIFEKSETTNIEEGFNATKKLADKGDPMAQNNLGSFYYNGIFGVKQDYTEALRWYEKAAASELPIANYNLGYMYANGVGVDLDKEKAAGFLKKAAEKDHAEAKFLLGLMLLQNVGDQQDFLIGYSYLLSAAEAGISQAYVLLGDMGRSGLLPNMGQNVEYANAMYEHAAMLGNGEGLFNLGCANAIGEGMERNFVMANVCFTLAVKYDHKDSISKVASTATQLSNEQKIEALELAEELKIKIDYNIRQAEKKKVIEANLNQSEYSTIGQSKTAETVKNIKKRIIDF